MLPESPTKPAALPKGVFTPVTPKKRNDFMRTKMCIRDRFLHELKVRGIVPESVKLATALLPTETEYNHQWDEHDSMAIKWDRLDSFSHKGMPDDKSYYSCIVHQLSVFSDAAKKVEELLENHEYVVVTGDHGSSRFAALAFHQENVIPISAPKKSTVRSFGRFCELDDNTGDIIALPHTVLATSNGKR